MLNDDDIFRRLLAQQNGVPQMPPTLAAPAPSMSPLDRQMLGLNVGGLQPPGPAPSGLSPLDRQLLGQPAAPAPPPPPVKPIALPTPQSIAQQSQSGYEQERAGLQAVAAAKGQIAQTEGAGELKAAQELQQRQAADAAAKEAADKEIGARRAALGQEVQQLSETRIDPSRLVHNMSTWQKIAGAIAIGLGGIPTAFGARNGGNQNVALSLIQGQIDKDIAAQTQDVETRKSAIGAKGTLLQQDIAMGRDAADARAKTTAALYDSAIRETQAQAKMLGTKTAQAEAQTLIGQLEQKKSQEDENHWAQQQQIANARAQTAIAGGHLALAQKQEKFSEGLQLGQFTHQLNQDITKRALAAPGAQAAGAPGDPLAIFSVSNDKNGAVRAARPEIAEDINKKIALATPVVQKINRLVEIRKDIGGGGLGILPDSEKALRAEAESLFTSLVYDMSLAQGQGVVRDSETAAYEKMLGDPTAWYSTLSRLEAAKNDTLNRVNAQIQDRTGVTLKERWNPPLRPGGAKEGDVSNAPPLPTGKAMSPEDLAAKAAIPADWASDAFLERNREGNRAKQAEDEARRQDYLRVTQGLPPLNLMARKY